MAKLKFGMIVTDMSGKLGGHVFAKNRGGSYARTKGAPTNPRTMSQTLVRVLFAAISSAWSGLSDAGRASFNGFVGAYARTDIFGDLRNPSGKALFQRLNQNLANTGQAQLTVCVAPVPLPSVVLTNIVADISDETMEISTEGNSSGTKIQVLGTPSLSQGTSFVKNDLRVLIVLNGGADLTDDIWNAYLAKFGTPVSGANIYFAIRVINANGQASPIQTLKGTINA